MLASRSNTLQLILLLLCIVVGSLSLASPDHHSPAATVFLRIEGAEKTIFESRITTHGHNVTTAAGGTQHCDGTNNHTNPTPGPTLTSALDDAMHRIGSTWDGTYFSEFDDYFITTIANVSQTDTEFWGLLIAYQFTPVGGCQQRVKDGDDVLIAFNAFGVSAFLKLVVPGGKTPVGTTVVATVTDGMTGNPVAGAVVSGSGFGSVPTGVDGTVRMKFVQKGVFKLKALKTGTVRSNEVKVVVI